MPRSRRFGSPERATAPGSDDTKKGPREMVPSGWTERGWELKKLGGMWLLIGKRTEPELPPPGQSDADVF